LVRESNLAPNSTERYLSVAYPSLTAHLVEAIKEQNVIINNLKERIEKLENQHGTE
jgi:hypothetical protein